IDPNAVSAMYNKRFAHYRVGQSVSAETERKKLEALDPDFIAALDDRGTKFFTPDKYDPAIVYELPSRWYDGEDLLETNSVKE
ncbi:MAG: hypothetical protein K8R01_06170, partial [Methanococcoides sp.]|nr:hypothetical protein [Methanococcoides sp.]